MKKIFLVLILIEMSTLYPMKRLDNSLDDNETHVSFEVLEIITTENWERINPEDIPFKEPSNTPVVYEFCGQFNWANWDLYTHFEQMHVTIPGTIGHKEQKAWAKALHNFYIQLGINTVNSSDFEAVSQGNFKIRRWGIKESGLRHFNKCLITINGSYSREIYIPKKLISILNNVTWNPEKENELGLNLGNTIELTVVQTNFFKKLEETNNKEGIDEYRDSLFTTINSLLAPPRTNRRLVTLENFISTVRSPNKINNHKVVSARKSESDKTVGSIRAVDNSTQQKKTTVYRYAPLLGGLTLGLGLGCGMAYYLKDYFNTPKSALIIAGLSFMGGYGGYYLFKR